MSNETNNNELNEEEVLESPLVVHDENDSSFNSDASNEMNSTHTETAVDEVTLERHRYKKTNKKNKAPFIILAVIVIACAVFAGLYFGGVVNLPSKETTTSTKKSYTTQAENPFAGIITVKGTYIFFEGKEVEGIEGLTNEIKYLDANSTFTIQDENADSNFLNLEVLSLLTTYNIKYEITHIVSSGLVSAYETTAPPETTAVPETAPQTDAPVQ